MLYLPQLLAPRRWLLRHDFVIELVRPRPITYVQLHWFTCCANYSLCVGVFPLQRGTQQKKDRCIFLFNDLVLFATVRRKSSFRRNVLSV